MRARADVFDEVATPVLVHFDLWDGNILVDGSATARWRSTRPRGIGSPRTARTCT
jgi:hypothetical protein